VNRRQGICFLFGGAHLQLVFNCLVFFNRQNIINQQVRARSTKSSGGKEKKGGESAAIQTSARTKTP